MRIPNQLHAAGPLLVAVLTTITSASLVACAVGDESAPLPAVSEPSGADLELADESFESLMETLDTTGTTGIPAWHERRRQLREHGPAAAIVAERRFDQALSDPDPMHRWTVIAAAGLVRTPAMVGLLRTVAEEPIGEADRRAEHGEFSAHAFEVMIRARALEGLRDLAVDGDREATVALEDNLTHPEVTLAMTAVQALLVVQGRTEAARERIRARLPESHRWMVDARRHGQPSTTKARGGAR